MLSGYDPFGLEGKVVIVTGASKGIGKGVALEFAKAGANVVIVARGTEAADKAVADVEALGSKAIKVLADVRKADQVQEMVSRTLEEFGTIDVLVNNAGGLLGLKHGIPFEELSEELWDDMIEQNLKTTFLCSQAVARVMIEQKKGGSIVNMSSIGGRVPSIMMVAYGAAKAGVSNLTASLSVHLGPHNIRVNCISPGAITTPLSELIYKDRREQRERQLRYVPLGRFGNPEDIGKVAVFLASDAAGYISGEDILVGGGQYHAWPPDEVG